MALTVNDLDDLLDTLDKELHDMRLQLGNVQMDSQLNTMKYWTLFGQVNAYDDITKRIKASLRSTVTKMKEVK